MEQPSARQQRGVQLLYMLFYIANCGADGAPEPDRLLLNGRRQAGNVSWVVWCVQTGRTGYLRNEAVHLLIMLCIWRGDLITSSVGSDEAGNSFVA